MCRSVEVHRSEWEVIAYNILIENVLDLKSRGVMNSVSDNVVRMQNGTD
jgi:hypothetical protein